MYTCTCINLVKLALHNKTERQGLQTNTCCHFKLKNRSIKPKLLYRLLV